MPYEHAYNLFNIPFWKQPIPLPTWFVILAVIVLAGTSNAVNLTDGMDGLERVVRHDGVCLHDLAYVIGDSIRPVPLYPPIPGAGELAVMCGAAVGACLGFLWYNPTRRSLHGRHRLAAAGWLMGTWLSSRAWS